MLQPFAPITAISAAPQGAMGACAYGGLGTGSIAMTRSMLTRAGMV